MQHVPGTVQTVKKPGDLVFGLRGELFRVEQDGSQRLMPSRRNRVLAA